MHAARASQIGLPRHTAPANEKAAKKGVTSRIRRTGKDLVAFRKMLKAERKRGVTTADLAKEHGVAMAYIIAQCRPLSLQV